MDFLKKQFRVLIWLLIWLTMLPVTAAAQEVMLRGMQKEQSRQQARIFMDLSGPVRPEVVVSGQRVDVMLAGTEVAAGFRQLPEDESLIRTLLISRREGLMVSFLFRRPPTDARVRYDSGQGQVQLHVDWSERGRGQRLAIVDQTTGFSQAGADGATVTKSTGSPYSEDWRRFFKEWETPFSFELAPRFSLPSMPLVQLPAGVDDKALPPALNEARAEADAGDWAKARQSAATLLDKPLEGAVREAFLVFYAEALLRDGRPKAAGATLRRFVENYPDSAQRLRARYLAGYCHAVNGDPYLGLYEVEQALSQIETDDFLLPRLLLLRGELLLAQGKYDQAHETLSSFNLSGTTDALRRLGYACSLSGLERNKEAAEIFAEMEEQYGPLRDPNALEHFARALYRGGAYLKAEEAYARLAQLISGHPDEGLAYFAQVQAALRRDDIEGARRLLDRILVAFPESRGGQRAAVRQIDLAVLDGGEKVLAWAVMDYGHHAENLSERALREEARFKQALALYLNRDHRRCVTVLEDFVRNHFSGDLRPHAEALLGEILPGVIEDMIADEDYLQALVMVERHRRILLDRRISWDFLERLAGAYGDMALLQRASRVYLFMLDNNRVPGRERGLYLPLVRILFLSGQHGLAVEYARQYAREYPEGEDRASVLLFEARALMELNRREQAADLLSATGRPASPELDLWAGRLCFEVNRYEDAASALMRLAPELDLEDDAGDLLLLAESLLRSNRPGEALPYFQQLVAVEETADQALYRIGQIMQQQGRKEQALNLFQRLVDEANSEQWQKMAREMLELMSLSL
ncbi:hypothetical protein GSUB_15040 [Geoalkalibacter subterraneus]|uniref:Tetratricopeptide repeat-like domain-containing protein n=1 Tax=Geoalkalibacter subterraneus TaxID=483547 RepID=A0A0B5FHD7_9BACT|nr:hypothetical protein GSUB_15040 [Geoalkalibacter subterraneus]